MIIQLTGDTPQLIVDGVIFVTCKMVAAAPAPVATVSPISIGIPNLSVRGCFLRYSSLSFTLVKAELDFVNLSKPSTSAMCFSNVLIAALSMLEKDSSLSS